MSTNKNPFELVIQNIRKRQDDKPQTPQLPVTDPVTAKILQLPLWADAVRCLPNEIVRSALFNARNHKQPRAYLKEAEIAVIGGGRIKFTGQELRQNDQTVWLQLIHLAKSQPIGEIVEFTPYSFCKSVGWKATGGDYIRLRECLTRMQATALSVYSDRLKEGVSLSMIPEFRWQDGKGRTLSRYQVQVAPKLVELFGDVHYTQVEWEQRLALPAGIATWMHGYYASHKKPYSIKIDTLKDGAKLTTINNSHAKRLIKNALKQLVIVGFLESFDIIDELIHVKRA